MVAFREKGTARGKEMYNQMSTGLKNRGGLHQQSYLNRKQNEISSFKETDTVGGGAAISGNNQQHQRCCCFTLLIKLKIRNQFQAIVDFANGRS
ncbi:hypothetical protein L1887_24783 [Cichorium endivia]|nr:hypothetical protein L1887_24783 [Cichorium endivia]